MTQLPKTPSSARVALWRRLRAAGATTMINGAWVLPETEAHGKLLGKLRNEVGRHGGTAFVLHIGVSPPEESAAIVARFRDDRGKEYDEFTERCAALLDEISREAKNQKYTFAEMEENEQDLEKLVRWLAKIQARDFFPDERQGQALARLAECRSAVESFAQAAYATEGAAGSGFPDTLLPSTGLPSTGLPSTGLPSTGAPGGTDPVGGTLLGRAGHAAARA